jgi:hypothetical protein
MIARIAITLVWLSTTLVCVYWTIGAKTFYRIALGSLVTIAVFLTPWMYFALEAKW